MKILTLCFVLIFLVTWRLSFSQTVDSIKIIANELNEKGDNTETIKLYRSLKKQKIENLDGEHLELLASAFDHSNKEDSAYYYYKRAKDAYGRSGNYEMVALMNLKIAGVVESQNNLDPDPSYFNDFWAYAKKTANKDLLAQGHNYLGRLKFSNQDPKVPLNHFRTAATIFDQIENIEQATTNIMNIGVVYSNRVKNNDSARFYYFKALDRLMMDNQHLNNTNLYHDLLNNIGNSFRRTKRYEEALSFYSQAETLRVKQYQTKTKKILYGNIEATYYYMGDFENAYNYLYKFDSIKDEISLASQNSTISDIEEKYDNEKLRADNLQIEAKRLKNRNWLIAALGFIVVGGLLGFFLIQDTAKKRLLAEQEAEIRQQRVENLLQEQELVTIDAMIAGQEKERQKVANELHDDLGSLMATIKLHFDHAQVSDNDPSLQNAKKLLEQAYQKIRGIAHAKNSGVMSDHGLLLAIEKLASVINESNRLQLTIEHFGLGDRLENSLELTIFRIIQELIANIIKHSEATQATIQLTHHDDNLNIIVEDNGKGFNPSNMSKGKGMGLTTIEKRIEHLGGAFTADSVLGKGTSILIDIPL